jgi:tRNA U34 2-thiouridine synthase MnmA/TrmU
MRAVALLSGGLDSILAAKLIKEQGIEVAALHFDNHFSACSENQKEKLLNKISKQLGIKFENKVLDKNYLSIIKNPKYGFGKNLNPCIDCRIYILKKAKEYMEKIGASFVITGEVLGQRPMSQHRKALFNVERESGLEGLILRPLSAKLFPETIPEKKGWVKRNDLLSISGRSRKIQLELANKYKIKNYLWAGGGCLLTDAGFSRRLQDIIKKGQFNLDNIELLKVGRHFRFNPSFKFIVGRNEKENQKLEYLKKEDDYLFKPIDQSGPTGLGRGKINQSIKELCTKIITRYSSADQDFKISIMNNKEKINEIAKAEMPENNKYRSFII